MTIIVADLQDLYVSVADFGLSYAAVRASTVSPQISGLSQIGRVERIDWPHSEEGQKAGQMAISALFSGKVDEGQNVI